MGQVSTASAQDAGSNTVFIEGIGNSLGFTINNERSVPVGDFELRLRAGAGIIPWNWEYSEDNSTEFSIPLTLAVSRWGIELGAGATFTSLDKNTFILSGVLAYRYVLNNNLTFRVSVSPVYWQPNAITETCGHYNSCPPREVWPFPGLSVGYRF